MNRYASSGMIFLLGVVPTMVLAQDWTPPRTAGPAAASSNTVSVPTSSGVLRVTALSDDVIRVRLVTSGPAPDHSYAVINRDPGSGSATISLEEHAARLSTGSLRVRVAYSPLGISFADSKGDLLDIDDETGGVAKSGSAFRVSKKLDDGAHVYGFGEKNGRLDKRGWQLGGYQYVMWNSDTYKYDSSTDPMYVSVPFYLVLRKGHAFGIFLDNTWRTVFDVGRERPGTLSFEAAGGDLDYYFINGPSPKQVIERYTELTGRMPMPPLWALGYNQCRWSYYPESKVRLLAALFREKQIPADVIWLDIHYLDGFKPFTWDQKRFPNPERMLSDLRDEGFRVVTIVDPHPKVEPGYPVYDEGIAGNYFVKNADGSVFEGKVWPSQAEKNPGPSAFVDFTQPAAREWWGSLYKPLLDAGVAGIWNDMNEPSVWDTATGTMPLNARQDNEGRPTDHREVHNVYGQQMSRATFEGLSRLRPSDRPFVLTRSSFAGGQRYAAVWSGDNSSDWSWLRQSLPTLMGMGISGFPLVGSDVGGFVGAPSAELFTRWLQTGVFYPFMRTHTAYGTPEQEPWSYGVSFEPINRRAIELRYELLPYIYTVIRESSETGLPAMRPLFLEYPEDDAVAAIDDEFMFGRDLLVAPVLWEGLTSRSLYLPAGDWYDYWTGRHYPGGKEISVPVTLETIPIFIRGGAVIFRQPVIQHTGQMPGNTLEVLVPPAKESSGSMYEDDGSSLKYRGGTFFKRQFHQIRTKRGITIDISSPEGSYRPKPRPLILEVMAETKPRVVTIRTGSGSGSLPRLDPSSLAKSERGWSFENGAVTVKAPDEFGGAHYFIEF